MWIFTAQALNPYGRSLTLSNQINYGNISRTNVVGYGGVDAVVETVT
jgi:hypothetical protein